MEPEEHTQAGDYTLSTFRSLGSVMGKEAMEKGGGKLHLEEPFYVL